jgi:hypothetical protein
VQYTLLINIFIHYLYVACMEHGQIRCDHFTHMIEAASLTKLWRTAKRTSAAHWRPQAARCCQGDELLITVLIVEVPNHCLFNSRHMNTHYTRRINYLRKFLQHIFKISRHINVLLRVRYVRLGVSICSLEFSGNNATLRIFRDVKLDRQACLSTCISVSASLVLKKA